MTKQPNHLDLPDNYSGAWTKSPTTALYHDPQTNHWHIALTDTRAGTYCTRFNPLRRLDLQNKRLDIDGGGYIIIAPHEGLKIGHLITKQLRFKGRLIIPCPNCLTMAAVESEMTGQRAYSVSKLIQALTASK